MSRMTGSAALSVVAVLAFVCGLGLLAFAWWTQPLAEAFEAGRAGDGDRALERYAAAESRFATASFTKQALSSAYQAAIANQLQLQYGFGRYDEVIEQAALSPSTAPIHFWAGCALFEKARAEQKRDQRITWLNRAAEEFRKTLEREPDDWDAKFNYELSRQLLSEMREEKTAKPDKILPLLRPQPQTNAPRRIG
jgi:tetratricopeptide (TPR) repeat protein